MTFVCSRCLGLINLSSILCYYNSLSKQHAFLHVSSIVTLNIKSHSLCLSNSHSQHSQDLSFLYYNAHRVFSISRMFPCLVRLCVPLSVCAPLQIVQPQRLPDVVILLIHTLNQASHEPSQSSTLIF